MVREVAIYTCMLRRLLPLERSAIALDLVKSAGEKKREVGERFDNGGAGESIAGSSVA